MSLLTRRRAMMGQNESGPIWLYNNGVTSDLIGGWNSVGYKYGSNFGQSIGATALNLYATTKWNNKGGRTYTGNNPLPEAFIGKTLHVKGNFKMNGDLNGGRSSYVYAFISESVQDVSNVESVTASGAFIDEIHTSKLCVQSGHEMNPGDVINFEMVLPITKDGYLSLVFFKGYSGLLYSYFREVWVE